MASICSGIVGETGLTEEQMSRRIQRVTEEIRSKWDEATKRSRRCRQFDDTVAWMPPIFVASDLPMRAQECIDAVEK